MNKTFTCISTMAVLSCMTAPVSAGLFSKKADKPTVAKIDKAPPPKSENRLYMMREEEDPVKNQGEAASAEEMRSGYNAPGRYDVRKKWSFYADASLIYWVPMPDKFNIATELEHSTPVTLNAAAAVPASLTGTPLRSESRGFDVQYRAGFKVGLGMNFAHDNWTMGAEWTRLSGSVEDKRHEGFPEFVIPAWVLQPLNGTAANKVEADWTFLFNIVDFGFSRPCYVGTKLIVTPYIGGRLFLQHQRVWASAVMNTDTTNPSSASQFPVTTTSKAQTWQIGPRLALDGKWLLGKGFHMDGDLAFSVQYAQSIINHEETGDIRTNGISTEAIDSHAHTHAVRPNMDLGVGFGWGSYVNRNREHLDLTLKYEFLTFWNSNDITSVSTTYDTSNLNLHGLTFTFRVDF